MPRYMNIIISLPVLLLLSIPLLFIAIVILIVDQEKPVYNSLRVGRNNVQFKMPKFRTMRSETPQIPTHLFDNPEEYLTKTGPFLRKHSLDELPQIFAVIRGDMSFVGPRPALFNQDDLILLRKEKNIHTLRPGITGWAQVNGRDALSIEEKVEYDEEYLLKQTTIFDFKIILLTCLRVLKKDGISH